MFNDPGMVWLVIILVGLVALVLYFLPSVVASERRHRERRAIFVLNLLLGWTFIGWASALVWSLTSHVEPPPEPPAADPVAAVEAAFWEDWLAELRGLALDWATREGEYFTGQEAVAFWGKENVFPLNEIQALRARIVAHKPLTLWQRVKLLSGWIGYRLIWHERLVRLGIVAPWGQKPDHASPDPPYEPPADGTIDLMAARRRSLGETTEQDEQEKDDPP